MQTIKFMYNNFFDVATVTALTTDSDYPLANLVHPWWSRAHHTTGHDDQWWKWDLGATNGAVGLLAAAFKYHNFSATSTIGLYGHASDLGDTPGDWIANATLKVPLVYGTDWNSKILCKYWTSAQIFKWWLLSVDDPDNGTGYLYLGRPFGGPWWSPTKNFANAFSVKYIDPSKKRYSFGGQLSVTKLQTYRGMRYAWTENNPLSSADMLTLRSIFENYVGQSTQYWICQDSDDKLNTTVYVENVTDWEIPHIFMDAYYQLQIEVKESQ